MRASDIRNMRKYLKRTYDVSDEILEQLFPKKGNFTIVTMLNKYSVIFNDELEVLIYTPAQVYLPTLRIVHMCMYRK